MNFYFMDFQVNSWQANTLCARMCVCARVHSCMYCCVFALHCKCAREQSTPGAARLSLMLIYSYTVEWSSFACRKQTAWLLTFPGLDIQLLARGYWNWTPSWFTKSTIPWFCWSKGLHHPLQFVLHCFFGCMEFSWGSDITIKVAVWYLMSCCREISYAGMSGLHLLFVQMQHYQTAFWINLCKTNTYCLCSIIQFSPRSAFSGVNNASLSLSLSLSNTHTHTHILSLQPQC